MSFTITCPHCAKTLRVTEPAFGKTVPCPGCGQPIQVEAPPLETSRAVGPPVRTGAVPHGREMIDSETQLPSAMPPMPPTDRQRNLATAGVSDGVDGSALPLGPPPFDTQLTEHSKAPATSSPQGLTKRPVGLVAIVFYWTFGGVAGILYGMGLVVVSGIMGGATQWASGISGSDMPLQAVVGMMLLELGALFLLFYGFCMLVTVYGLWTYQQWALPMAKRLAGVNAVLALIGLGAAMIARTGLVLNTAAFAASIAIVVYLFGSETLVNFLQQGYSRIGQTRGMNWKEYGEP